MSHKQKTNKHEIPLCTSTNSKNKQTNKQYTVLTSLTISRRPRTKWKGAYILAHTYSQVSEEVQSTPNLTPLPQSRTARPLNLCYQNLCLLVDLTSCVCATVSPRLGRQTSGVRVVVTVVLVVTGGDDVEGRKEGDVKGTGGNVVSEKELKKEGRKDED